MKILNHNSKLLVVCIALMSAVAFIKADYYQPNFFPIGLTGLNSAATGSDNCPYGAILDGSLNPLWKWENNAQYPDQTERKLIFNLGINCLGCQDAKATYLVNWGNKTASNYLSKVSSPSFLEQDTSKRIYLITASYYSHPQYDSCPDTVLCSDTLPVNLVSWATADNIPASALFRSTHRPHQPGFGSRLFSYYSESNDDCPGGCTNIDSMWGCHGTHGENWSTYDGDEHWQAMADEAVNSFSSYFSQPDTLSDNIWGFNLITEDPAMCDGGSSQGYGNWAAVDRVLRGKNTEFHVPVSTKSDSSGFRGVTFGDGKDRMVVAKGHVWMYANPSVNIFEYLPDIDVLVEYNHYWHRASDDYGAEALFDRLLYGSSHADSLDSWEHPEGYHNTAVYMQRYGGTGGGPSGQRRRWMPGLCLEWKGITSDGDADTRRPCPPEIRCAAYLCLSRGAKGILFHPWSYEVPTTSAVYPDEVSIPALTRASKGETAFGFALRDNKGYPFGEGGPDSVHHRLNDGTGSGYWHSVSNNADSTYKYLITLIKEIKLLVPTLLHLDWVNGYSLHSTDPGWASPCPHAYVMDVSGVSYMDLGLFNNPSEPVGVEYFMLVNREGIADMTNRNVTVALDAGHWSQEDSLVLTDIAHKDSPKTLVRDGDRFVFTQVFEPGEGKLYRVAAVK